MMLRKIAAVSVLCFMLGAISTVSYSQEETDAGEMRIVKGRVKEVNWVGEKIVVRTFERGESDEMTFIVAHNTKITKGTSTIPLGDIIQSNSVTITYYSTLAGLKAVQIMVRK